MNARQKKIQLTREAMLKVARILAGRGIKITQAGSQPYVRFNNMTKKIERVNIPMLPDDASDTLIHATHGFLDHEIGHVMFTDWEYAEVATKAKCHTLFNILEDTYVERMMQMEFTGSISNLGKASIIFTTKYIEPTYQEMLKEGTHGEKDWWNLLCAVAIRAISGQTHFQEYMDQGDKWALIPNMHKILKGYENEIQNIIASHESCEIAMDIKKVLVGDKPRKKTPEEEQESEEQGEDGDDGSSDENQDMTPGDGEVSDEENPTNDDTLEVDPDDIKDESESGNEESSEEQEAGDEGPNEESDGESGDSSDSGDGDSEEESDESESGSDGDESDSESEDDSQESDGDAESDDGESKDTEDEDGQAGSSAGGEDSENESDAGDSGKSNSGDSDDLEDDEDGADGANVDEDDDGWDEDGEAGSDQGEDTEEEESDDFDGSDLDDDGDDEEIQDRTATDSNVDDPDEIDPNEREEPLILMTEDEVENDPADFDDSMSKLIGEMAESTLSSSNEYTPFTREWDVVEKHKIPKRYDSSWAQEIDDSVKHMVGPLSKSLERAFRAANKSRWEGGKKSGRINGASLSRLLTNDPRVMRTREEMKTKDVAVTLLMDCSGSMSGGKAVVATQASWALAEMLNKLGLANEVMGFTTMQIRPEHQYLESELRNNHRSGVRFDRYEPLYVPIFKAFEERFGTEQKARLASVPNHDDFMWGNVDGESLLYAAERLRKRTEPGKVMIVLSDGMPAGGGGGGDLNAHLKKTIQDLNKEGINTVGIGINTNSVKQFYPRSVSLNNIEDLPKEVMGQLREAILGKRD